MCAMVASPTSDVALFVVHHVGNGIVDGNVLAGLGSGHDGHGLDRRFYGNLVAAMSRLSNNGL